jgi:hypothetical protein
MMMYLSNGYRLTYTRQNRITYTTQSLTPPAITYNYNQQIRLTYTTTPVLVNETTSGYDPFMVSLLHSHEDGDENDDGMIC